MQIYGLDDLYMEINAATVFTRMNLEEFSNCDNGG
jgi:3-methyladenine DNA glycosylase AlkC